MLVSRIYDGVQPNVFTVVGTFVPGCPGFSIR